MGFAKHDMITCQERGYGHSEKTVCRECIGNQALKNYIKTYGMRAKCDYCGKTRLSLPLEDLMPAIMSGISYQYDRAVDVLPCDDGEYLGTTYSTEDLIRTELYDEIDVADERILDDIISIMEDDVWCEADPFAERQEEQEFNDWENFCKLVKTKVRYVFYQTKQKSDDMSDPVGILDKIADHMSRLNLKRRIDRTQLLYRGRTHEDETWFTELEDFAPPPFDKTPDGRMNAAGINIFYLTLEPETSLSEISTIGRDFASIATFRLKETITVVDLTKIDSVRLPSIFDEKERNKRSAIRFLRRFVENISQPAVHKAIDYVPTQIVTEYFRHVYVHPKYGSVQGILYNSAQNPGGKCLALFLNRDEVLKGKYGVHMDKSKTLHYQKKYRMKPEEPGKGI